jgi:hypothetical protein
MSKEAPFQPVRLIKKRVALSVLGLLFAPQDADRAICQNE